jgi:hypoxanthine phosphoribosyltransferase
MPVSSTPAPTAFFPSPETMEVLFTKEQIAERTRQIGAQISADYEGQSIVLIGVL